MPSIGGRTVATSALLRDNQPKVPLQSIRFDYCWLLPRRKVTLCCEGSERVRAHRRREVAAKLKGLQIDA